MKRGTIILLLLVFTLLPITLAETPTSTDLANQVVNPEDSLNQIPNTKYQIPGAEPPRPSVVNPWNETIIISDTWQQLIGTFFGLNLKNVSTEISVREALLFFSIFIMFLVIIFDILKLTPFFKIKLGPISGEFIAAIIITTLVSISGVFINLKDLFLNLISDTINSLHWSWIGSSSILTGVIVIIVFIAIWAFFDFLNPIIKKHSQLSRAEAKGRLLNTVIEKSDV